MRDDYQAGANFTFAGDPSAVTTDDIAAEKTKLLAAAQSPIAKASIGKLTDDQIRDRIATEQKDSGYFRRVVRHADIQPRVFRKQTTPC